MKITALFVGLIGFSRAIPTTDTYKSIARVDNYDNGRLLVPIGGTAGGFIKYNAWSYALVITPKAPSGISVASTGIRGQTLEGQPAFLPLNDEVNCFDMRSIRNGCFANTQTTGIVLPVSCTVQFSARLKTSNPKTNGQTVIQQAIYNPKLGEQTPFNTTTFLSNFKCIDRVDITLISAALPGGGATVGVALDDFSYVARVKQ